MQKISTKITINYWRKKSKSIEDGKTSHVNGLVETM
jgi:hypothetical protein